MQYQTFIEYLNNKKKLQTKPTIEEVPDYHGDTNKTPEIKGKRKNIKNNQVVETYPTFLEYLNSKGEMQTKAIVDKTGDQVDMPADRANAPEPPSAKGKNWTDPQAITSKPAPYKAANSNIPAKDSESGLGDLGDKKLKINYKTDVDSESPYGGEKAPQLFKTESFLNKTKDLLPSKFASTLLEDCKCKMGGDIEKKHTPFVTVYRIGKVQPDPHETIRYLSRLTQDNPALLSALIRELKREHRGMKPIADEFFSHPESYDELADMIDSEENGPYHAERLIDALSNKYNKFLDGMTIDESVGKPFHKEDDEDNSDEDFSVPDDDLESDEEPEEYPEPSEEDEEMPPPEKKSARPKRKFGHDHMLGAMKKHGYMMDSMKKMLDF